jgi:hypothetical protein
VTAPAGDLTCPRCGRMRADTLAEWSAHPSRCRATVRAGDGGGGFDSFGQALCAERCIARLEDRLAHARGVVDALALYPDAVVVSWPPHVRTVGHYVDALRVALGGE